MVVQLHLGVGWVRAGEDPAGTHDGHDEHTVIDLYTLIDFLRQRQ